MKEYSRDLWARATRAIQTAVHRDLVKPGIWTVEMGADYRSLHALRNTGDYGWIGTCFVGSS